MQAGQHGFNFPAFGLSKNLDLFVQQEAKCGNLFFMILKHDKTTTITATGVRFFTTSHFSAKVYLHTSPERGSFHVHVDTDTRSNRDPFEGVSLDSDEHRHTTLLDTSTPKVFEEECKKIVLLTANAYEQYRHFITLQNDTKATQTNDSPFASGKTSAQPFSEYIKDDKVFDGFVDSESLGTALPLPEHLKQAEVAKTFRKVYAEQSSGKK
jgi:hypothetical protein